MHKGEDNWYDLRNLLDLLLVLQKGPAWVYCQVKRKIYSFKQYWGLSFHILMRSISFIFNFVFFTRNICSIILPTMNREQRSVLWIACCPQNEELGTIFPGSQSARSMQGYCNSFRNFLCGRTIISIFFP